MKISLQTSRAFTLIEIITVLSIFVILFTIGTYAFINTGNRQRLNTAVDSITFKLEEMKANAISGKGNTNFGVKFNANSYVSFSGASFSTSGPNNVTYPVSGNFTLSNTIPGPDDAIIFARITGTPNTTGDITLTDSKDPTHPATITIGSLGDISVVK